MLRHFIKFIFATFYQVYFCKANSLLNFLVNIFLLTDYLLITDYLKGIKFCDSQIFLKKDFLRALNFATQR